VGYENKKKTAILGYLIKKGKRKVDSGNIDKENRTYVDIAPPLPFSPLPFLSFYVQVSHSKPALLNPEDGSDMFRRNRKHLQMLYSVAKLKTTMEVFAAVKHEHADNLCPHAFLLK
jgi:hypothetical protein